MCTKSIPRGTLNVKFGIYMHQTTIFRGGWVGGGGGVVLDIFYHPIYLIF